MTIAQFEQLVAALEHLAVEHMISVPIRSLAFAHNGATREFTTAIVQATLRRR